MTTETDKGTTLTEKEGAELFAKAFSEIQGTEYKEPISTEVAPPVEEAQTAVEAVVTPAEVETKEEETPPVVEEARAKPTATTPEAILEEFPEDKRDFVRQLMQERQLAEQKFRSHQGRLAAERKRAVAAEQELIKLRKGASRPQQDAVAEQSKIDHAKALEEWKQVAEAEPTLAKAVDALTDAKVKDLESRLSQREQTERETAEIREAEEFKQREWELLVERVPNVMDVISSPEFHYWKDNLAPPAIRNMTENSVSHQDALFVLENFTPYALWVNEQSNKGKEKPLNPDTVAADKISETRKDKVSPVVNKGALQVNTRVDVGNEFGDDVADQLLIEAYNKIKQR